MERTSNVLVSFDIDGTLEAGDPPGPIEFTLVAEALSLGYVVGSSSDRTMEEQRRIWAAAGLTVDFISHKHNLAEATSQFTCDRKIHIGDTSHDEYHAKLAGFEFHYVTKLPGRSEPGWIF